MVAGKPYRISDLALASRLECADAVAGLIRGTGRFGEPRVHEDYAGRDRIVMAEPCFAWTPGGPLTFSRQRQ